MIRISSRDIIPGTENLNLGQEVESRIWHKIPT